MGTRRLAGLAAAAAALALGVGACGDDGGGGSSGGGGGGGGDKPYIPMVSKGFQHQFWQAVKRRRGRGRGPQRRGQLHRPGQRV